MPIKQYRKIPVVIKAVQWTGTGEDMVDISKLAEDSPRTIRMFKGCLEIGTLEGVMTALLGDWIIRGIAGEIYPCKDEIFRATYQEVVLP